MWTQLAVDIRCRLDGSRRRGHFRLSTLSGRLIIAILTLSSKVVADSFGEEDDENDKNFHPKGSLNVVVTQLLKFTRHHPTTIPKIASKSVPRCTCQYSSSLDTSGDWKPEASPLLKQHASSEESRDAVKQQLLESGSGVQQEEGSPNETQLQLRQDDAEERTEADILQLERADSAEDCPFCRALDCDIIFALLFTLVIGCLFVLIMVFWLRAFTDCDHIFDSTHSQGTFSLPIFPQPPAIPQRHFDSGLEDGPVYADDESAYRDAMKGFKKGSAGQRVLPNNIQWNKHLSDTELRFIARPNQRVQLEFTHFQLAGTPTNCDMEYVDIYSELTTPSDDLLVASLGGRYCGTAAPRVRISLNNVMVLVFHSRVGVRRSEKFLLDGHYQYISETRYIPGKRLPGIVGKCAFLIESSKRIGLLRKQGTILSPTYPGTYPNNFYCAYLLKGEPTERIRLYMRDFDIYFAGEHCPYDALTVYDGYSNTDHIIKKICGLQQRMEIFSGGPHLLIEFNTTDPAKGDPRGFSIEYEFSRHFVDLRHVIGDQKGISHIRGTECDFRVRSDRESVHYIESPSYPNRYPPNTTCAYILDGLQGDQDLEKVILEFEEVSLLASNDADGTAKSPSSRMTAENGDECAGSFIGVATTSTSIKAVLANNEESVYDATLCNRIAKGSPRLGPYTSQGPRLVVVFGSAESTRGGEQIAGPIGFKARVEFKTDFGVPGVPMGDSSKCQFLFQSIRGSFNSPRFPANYPLDSNCTYHIRGKKGDQILLYFQQFALFEENSKDVCNDYVEVFDVLHDANGKEHLILQAKHCWTMFPGPTISTFGAHEMRVVFSSDSFGTANGFNGVYEIRKAFKEDVPMTEYSDRGHCGHVIAVVDGRTSGYFTSPGFPVKYSKDQICDWEIRARPGRQILLQLVKMDVEGEMTDTKTSCGAAVIRVHLDYNNRSSDVQICGTNPKVIAPILSLNDSIRISFLTAPEKVNGLQGFNFTWTEVRLVDSDNQCSGRDHYLCSYTRLCIASSLRCNGDENCGENDDTDEAHCNIAEKASDSRTIMIAATFSGFIFLFIFGFFCILFKAKLERRQDKEKRKKRDSSKRSAKGEGNDARRQRQPYRPAKKSQQQTTSRSATMPETSPQSYQPKLPTEVEMRGIDTSEKGVSTGTAEEFSSMIPSPSVDKADVQIFYG